MRSQKSTKRALLTSLLCLLLCISMLLGTTFAWFTDSVTTGVNVIQSGTLDIKMSYSDKLDGTYTDVEKTTEGIFNYAKWEPGYTEIRYIKLENAGNLAFKYALDIVPQSAAVADAVDLAEVLEVSYAVAPSAAITTRDLPGMTKAGTLDTILYEDLDFANGVLLPAGEVKTGFYAGDVVVAVALKMQESAGNTYQDKTVGGGFTVRVLATQYTYETDSVDDQYDAKAAYVSFDPNGGSGVMSLFPVTAGEAATLPYNKLTHPDYAFNGWNTKADGTGTAYTNGANITVGENTILYAQWTKNINDAMLNIDSARLPAELVGGEVAPNMAGIFSIPEESNGISLTFRDAALWIQSDDAIPSSSTSSSDIALSSGATFTSGKHYFLCTFLDADLSSGFNFDDTVVIRDNEGHEYFVEYYDLGFVDELRIYRYIGQAK